MAAIKTSTYNHKITTDEVGNSINFTVKGSAMVFDLLNQPLHRYDAIQDELSEIADLIYLENHTN
jgi:hypothetical protein